MPPPHNLTNAYAAFEAVYKIRYIHIKRSVPWADGYRCTCKNVTGWRQCRDVGGEVLIVYTRALHLGAL